LPLGLGVVEGRGSAGSVLRRSAVLAAGRGTDQQIWRRPRRFESTCRPNPGLLADSRCDRALPM